MNMKFLEELNNPTQYNERQLAYMLASCLTHKYRLGQKQAEALHEKTQKIVDEVAK